MWQQTSVALDSDIAAMTTSVFRRKEYPAAEVGLMRFGLFQPPFLWLRWERVGSLPLRSVNAWLDELQELVFEPVVYAEAHTEVSERFLCFCRFAATHNCHNEHLYVRKL